MQIIYNLEAGECKKEKKKIQNSGQPVDRFEHFKFLLFVAWLTSSR
jgi:hypothetical protein